MHGRVAVVAVCRVADIAGRGVACARRDVRVAEAVAVRVYVPGGRVRGVLIDDPVAVLVHAVTVLGGARVHGGVAVVAVALGEAVPVKVDLAAIRR